jgi:hypothetical protein
MEPNAASEIRGLVPILIWLAYTIAFLVVYGGSVGWVVRDAQERGYSGAALILLVWLCGPLAALIWLLVRPRTKLVERPVHGYATDDDALVAASKLDMLGDWDEATALYQHAAARWPEHGGYIEECIKVINDKKAGRKP